MSLGRFLIRRTLQGLVVIWGAVTVMFLLRELSPADPAVLMLGQGAREETIQAVREQEGLNDPVVLQYVEYLQRLVVGDLGFSWQSDRPVTTMVLERVPATIELAVAATIVAIVIAIPLGVISATRRNESADYAATVFSLLGISTPNFWLGLMLILVFAVWYGIPYPTITGTGGIPVSLDFYQLPVGRRPVGFGEAIIALFTQGSISELLTWLQHITLPAIALGTYFTALITRLTRSGMLEEIGKAYVTAAKAKGLPETIIRYKHVLRNTMIPIITVLGLQLGTLLGGAVITETVFEWPGLGLRLISAIDIRDWPLMQGVVVFIAAAFVTINIFVDALYAYLDPQVGEIK